MGEYIYRKKYDFHGRRNAFKSRDQIRYSQKQKYGKQDKAPVTQTVSWMIVG